MSELLDRGHELLEQMDDHLKDRDWLVGETPTIADIALYAYTHSAGAKGGFDLARFPAVNAWLARVADVPGHITLTDIPA